MKGTPLQNAEHTKKSSHTLSVQDLRNGTSLQQAADLFCVNKCAPTVTTRMRASLRHVLSVTAVNICDHIN